MNPAVQSAIADSLQLVNLVKALGWDSARIRKAVESLNASYEALEHLKKESKGRTKH